MKTHLEGCTIFAVDFDGTLCVHRFPQIGEPNTQLIEWLIKRQEEGDKLILWTNRMGQYLDNAVAWCEEKGLRFDAVNDNIPEIMELYKDVLNGRPPSRKITADVFIDDAACGVGFPFGDPECGLGSCWVNNCPHKKV